MATPFDNQDSGVAEFQQYFTEMVNPAIDKLESLAPDEVKAQMTTLANGLRTAGLVQHFTLAQAPASLLHEGDNVLALEVHDATGGFFLTARLRAELDERQVTDAGFADAGLPGADAGAVLDAGLRDAGLAVDAGPLAVDAGPAPAATSSKLRRVPKRPA